MLKVMLNPTFIIYKSNIQLQPIGTDIIEKKIRNIVEEVTDIPFKEWKRRSSKEHNVLARQLYCYLVYHYTKFTLKTISKYLSSEGPITHSTILYARNNIQEILEIPSHSFYLQATQALEMMKNYRIERYKETNGYHKKITLKKDKDE